MAQLILARFRAGPNPHPALALESDAVRGIHLGRRVVDLVLVGLADRDYMRDDVKRVVRTRQWDPEPPKKPWVSGTRSRPTIVGRSAPPMRWWIIPVAVVGAFVLPRLTIDGRHWSFWIF